MKLIQNAPENVEVLNINTISEVEALKDFYTQTTEESDEQLKNDLQREGQLLSVVVNKENELIDGYRRVRLLRELGVEELKVIVIDQPATLDLRLSFNMYRQKTSGDLTKEVLFVFTSTPKKQGSRGGEKYNRTEIISEKLKYRWKSNKTIGDIEKVISKDFDTYFLLDGIVNKGWSINECLHYVDELREIDLKKGYGFTDQLIKGGLNINQVNKFINDREFLSNEYKDTFIIPEKSTSLRMNCTDIRNQVEFHSKVATLMCSIPFWKLRFYENEEGYNQLGHEKTPEEFAANVADIFVDLQISLKKSANVFVNIGDSYVDGCAMDVPGLVKRAILEKTDLKLKDVLIWSKPVPKPQSEEIKRPINKLEYILWFVVDPKEAKYNMITYTDRLKEIKITNGAKDVDENGVVWKKSKSLSKPYQKIYNHISQQEVEHMIVCATGKNVPLYKAHSEGHPAAMAELLPVLPIMMTTDEGDLVFDPFGGGNTTGRIALLLNRNYLSTELSHHYHKVGCKVIENTLEEVNQDDFNALMTEVFGQELETAA
jgi:DNA modification methylase